MISGKSASSICETVLVGEGEEECCFGTFQ